MLGAEVVKAFNTVFAQVLAEGGAFGNGQQVPVAGLNIYLGYMGGLGTDIAPAWLHRA